MDGGSAIGWCAGPVQSFGCTFVDDRCMCVDEMLTFLCWDYVCVVRNVDVERVR